MCIFKFFIVTQLELSPSFPHCSPLPYPPPPPTSSPPPTPLSWSTGPLYMFLDFTFPHWNQTLFRLNYFNKDKYSVVSCWIFLLQSILSVTWPFLMNWLCIWSYLSLCPVVISWAIKNQRIFQRYSTPELATWKLLPRLRSLGQPQFF